MSGDACTEVVFLLLTHVNYDACLVFHAMLSCRHLIFFDKYEHVAINFSDVHRDVYNMLIFHIVVRESARYHIINSDCKFAVY